MVSASCNVSSARLLLPPFSMDARGKPAHDEVVETC